MRVHVNPGRLRFNASHGRRQPPLVIETSDGPQYGFLIEHSAFRVVTSEDGAHAWIEILEPFEVDGQPLHPESHHAPR